MEKDYLKEAGLNKSSSIVFKSPCYKTRPGGEIYPLNTPIKVEDLLDLSVLSFVGLWVKVNPETPAEEISPQKPKPFRNFRRSESTEEKVETLETAEQTDI